MEFLEASQSFDASSPRSHSIPRHSHERDPSVHDAATDQEPHQGAAAQEGHAPDSTSKADAGQLVKLHFSNYSMQSSLYKGLDTEIAVDLDTLYFFCNRPTVAALMTFGKDIAEIPALLKVCLLLDSGHVCMIQSAIMSIVLREMLAVPRHGVLSQNYMT